MADATRMSESQIEEALAGVPEWSEMSAGTSGEIQRTFQFATFRDAIAFVHQVADYAEQAQHHPNILIRYSKVTLSVNTHDAGGITAKDFELAHACDKLFTAFPPATPKTSGVKAPRKK